jgi:hypothetical protein
MIGYFVLCPIGFLHLLATIIEIIIGMRTEQYLFEGKKRRATKGGKIKRKNNRNEDRTVPF